MGSVGGPVEEEGTLVSTLLAIYVDVVAVHLRAFFVLVSDAESPDEPYGFVAVQTGQVGLARL